jgi:hypothetical protein
MEFSYANYTKYSSLSYPMQITLQKNHLPTLLVCKKLRKCQRLRPVLCQQPVLRQLVQSTKKNYNKMHFLKRLHNA